MNCSTYKKFWVSWKAGNITIGRENSTHDILMAYEDPCPFFVQDIQISTDHGGNVNWIIEVPVSNHIQADPMQSKVVGGMFRLVTDCPTFQILRTTSTTHLIECAAICMWSYECVAVDFVNHDGVCELVSDVAVADTSSSYYRIVK